MWIFIACIAGSVAASVITTKILATYYFKIVDGYVSDMINDIGELVELAKIIVHNEANEKGGGIDEKEKI